jgi:3-oxoacyl-[acyl-carrier protein] reductase
MQLDLRGKGVLVTGGSRGIGLAIARHFAAEGARVAICGRDLDALTKAAASIRDAGGDAMAIQADLSGTQAASDFVDRAAQALGRIDVLVNNASTNVDGSPSRLEDATDSQVLERITGKLMAAIRCSRAAIPHMRRSGGGRIICIGGTSARAVTRSGSGRAGRTELPQGLGNSAMANFVKHLSEELAHERILVNIVHPSVTRTDRHPARVAKFAAQHGIDTEQAEARMSAGVPIGRMVEPADIAPLVLFLASPLASAITGQAIAVDGGAVPAVTY